MALARAKDPRQLPVLKYTKLIFNEKFTIFERMVSFQSAWNDRSIPESMQQLANSLEQMNRLGSTESRSITNPKR
jgi:hypothetical protein